MGLDGTSLLFVTARPTPSAHCAPLICPHQLQRPLLVQRFVEVAALGALHAGGAAGLAGALGDQPLGVAEQALELLVAAQGDPDPAGVAVVDEDRRAAGLEVDVGREAADVPAVAHRDQRQHRDLAVLGRVQGAEQDVGRQRAAEPVGQHVPERLGGELLLGQLQRDDVEGLLVGDRDPLVGDHLLGHRDLAEVQLDPRGRALLAHPLDVDLGLLLRPRVPVAVEARDDRPPPLHVELLDLVGAAEVEVDRAGVDRGEGALGLDQAEHLARLALDHRDRVGRGRAQRDLGGDELAAARHHPPARLAQLARRRRAARARSRQPAPEDLGVLLAQRQLVGRGDHVPRGDLLAGVVEDRRLDRAADELVGVAAEELVERVLAGDVDGEAAAPAPRPPPHLAQAGDGAGEGDADRRVELADVDAQLERVGGDDREQLAVATAAPRSRAAAAACSRRGRARSAPPAPACRAPPAIRGRSAGSARSRAGS